MKRHYKQLVDLSNDVNKQIDLSLSEKEKVWEINKRKIKDIKLKDHPTPIEFNNNIKYVIFNINPSLGRSKNSEKQILNGKYLFWIRKSLLEKGNIELKDFKMSLKDTLLFSFHKKHIDLLEGADPKARIFWEEKKEIKKIINQNHKGKDIKEDLQKIMNLLNNEKKNFIVFCELVYYRYKTQKKNTKINNEK